MAAVSSIGFSASAAASCTRRIVAATEVAHAIRAAVDAAATCTRRQPVARREALSARQPVVTACGPPLSPAAGATLSGGGTH